MGLALDLVREGYIDNSFTLYTSVYADSLVSASAQSYRIQFVNRRFSSYLADLTPEDIAEIRAKVGDSFLEEPSVLNVSIFDALLESGALDSAVSMIASGQLDAQREFTRVYFARGRHAVDFARALAPHADWILTLIADEAELSEKERLDYLLGTFRGLRPEIDYETTPEVDRLVGLLAAQSLGGVGSRLERDDARSVARLLVGAQARIPTLSMLSRAARREVGAQGAFAMTRENLAALANARDRIGLDSIFRAQPTALPPLLGRLAEYLDVVESASLYSIDSADRLMEVLNELAERGPAVVEAVMSKRADSRIALEELPGSDDNPSEALNASYPALSRTDSFVPTAQNVVAYLDVVGTVDEALAGYLSRHPALSAADELEDDARQTLVDSFAGASGIPVVALASLLRSVRVEGTIIDPRLVRVEDPEVARLLVREGLVADEGRAFIGMRGWPWPAREAALAESKAAPEFITSLGLNSENLGRVLGSAVIDAEVKRAILADPDQVAKITTQEAARTAVQAAVLLSAQLDAGRLLALHEAGAPAVSIVEYLGTNEQLLADVELTSTLAGLGGDWAILASNGNGWRAFDPPPGFDALIERLKRTGLVSKTSTTLTGKVRVTMRKA